MKVNWIEITNIKSFRQTTKVRLNSDNNFVVGTNGSGKTTLFQVLSSCLLLMVPQYRAEMQNNDNRNKVRLIKPDYPTNLSKNYAKQNDLQSVKLEVSFENSKKALINEIEQYLTIFRDNESYIQNSFFDYDDLVERTRSTLATLKLHTQPMIFEIVFDIGEHTMSINQNSKTANSAILNALELIEAQRIVHYRLFQAGKTIQPVEKGFRLIYLGAERSISFPTEVSLHRGSQDEYLTNTSNNQNVELLNYIYSSGSFNYINQTLTRIAEKVVYERWQNREEAPLEKIEEVKILQENMRNILDLGLEFEIPGSPYEAIKLPISYDGKIVNFENLSSGEKTLVNFLFILQNPEIKNSFVIIDEAEIHLHGDMQQILLELLTQNNELDNQHFISTHSPKMVNRLTLSSVIRFYKTNKTTKHLNFAEGKKIGTDYDIIRLINSQNNEKVFFADKVVLVEGIKDRILIEDLIHKLKDSREIIEVIDVGGKHNLSLYRSYLDTIEVPNYIVADFDYAYDLGISEINSLLVVDEKKIDKFIKDKHSEDRRALIAAIEQYVKSDEKTNLSEVMAYLRSRGQKLKDSLSDADKLCIKGKLAELHKSKIFIIHSGIIKDKTQYSGEIEDFLKHIPSSKNNSDAINNLVKAISKDDFLSTLIRESDKEISTELLSLIGEIIAGDKLKFAGLITS